MPSFAETCEHFTDDLCDLTGEPCTPEKAEECGAEYGQMLAEAARDAYD